MHGSSVCVCTVVHDVHAETQVQNEPDGRSSSGRQRVERWTGPAVTGWREGGLLFHRAGETPMAVGAEVAAER